jgi:hypothetical protein
MITIDVNVWYFCFLILIFKSNLCFSTLFFFKIIGIVELNIFPMVS